MFRVLSAAPTKIGTILLALLATWPVGDPTSFQAWWKWAMTPEQVRFCGLIVALLVALYWLALWRMTPVQLTVELEVYEHYGDGNTDFGFLISNIGNVDAQLISHRYQAAPDHGFAIGNSPKNLLIKKGAKLNVRVPPFTKIGDRQSIAFDATYSGLGWFRKRRTDHFVFQVSNSASPRSYSPVFHQDSGLNPPEPDLADIGKSLRRAEGSVSAAVFNEESGVVITSSDSRRILLDFDNRIVRFQMIVGRSEMTVSAPMEDDKAAHLFIVSWKEAHPSMMLAMGGAVYEQPTTAHLITDKRYD